MKHGHTGSGGKTTPTYRSWRTMLNRCQNPGHEQYKDYGGRGIKVCDRWLSFENFLEDMGERPEGMTLDREDKEKDYEPSNCRWATWKEQAREKRVLFTHMGVTRSLSDWAEVLGISVSALHHRIYKYGWPVWKALSTPRRY